MEKLSEILDTFGIVGLEIRSSKDFRPVEEFKHHLDNWIEHFKSAKAVSPDQKVIIPDKAELEAELDRKVNGIPLVDAVVKDLNEVAEKLGVEWLSGI